VGGDIQRTFIFSALICALTAALTPSLARAWAPTDAVPLPCAGAAGTPNNHRLFRECPIVIDDVRAKLRERTRTLIKGANPLGSGGYYSGKVESFSTGNQWPMTFGTPVCDMWAGEVCPNNDPRHRDPLCAQCNAALCEIRDGQIWVTFWDTTGCGGNCQGRDAGRCGETCTGTGASRVCTANWCRWGCECQRLDDRFYLDVSTCDRELAWLRGGWVRDVSLQWLRVVEAIRVGYLYLPVLGARAQAQITPGSTTTTPVCVPLAEEYMRLRDRIASSRVWSFWNNITPEMCSEGSSDGKAMAACHLKIAREAIEGMYVQLAACVQMAYAMTDYVDVLIQGDPRPQTFTVWGGTSITFTVYPTLFHSVQGHMQYGHQNAACTHAPGDYPGFKGCKDRIEEDDEFDYDDPIRRRVSNCYEKYVTDDFKRHLEKGGMSPYRWTDHSGRWPITSTDDAP
jgi:hypothetical protein